MLVPPLLPVTFALAMMDDICLIQKLRQQQEIPTWDSKFTTTDHSDGQWELSDLWTKRKQNLLCIQENVFVSQRHFIS